MRQLSIKIVFIISDYEIIEIKIRMIKTNYNEYYFSYIFLNKSV